MRVLILTFVLSKLIFAQYDSTMYDLIKTTYSRNFDKQIISKYLDSDNDCQTRAAILSIAQSEDTSFVPELLKLDLTKYGSEICFALAQIGNCEQSINFLYKYFFSYIPLEEYSKVLFAIGKIGGENDFKNTIKFDSSFAYPIFPFNGISVAFLQFQIRGLTNEDSKAVLETEIFHEKSYKSKIKQALFTLSRYKNSSLTEEQLQSLIRNFIVNEEDTELKQFVLMNINKQLSIDDILELNNPLLAIHFIKVLHFFHFVNKTYPEKNIELYFKYLFDENPNVAIQAAISIKNLKDVLNDSSKTIIKNKIDTLLVDTTKSLSFRGELFLSRFELFGDFEEHQLLLDKISISNKNRFDFYSMNPDKYTTYTKLVDSYLSSSSMRDKIDALPFILELQNSFLDSITLKMVFINALSSEIAPLISIAADGIDSIFISGNCAQLKVIISNQIDKYKDNPDFLEATMSLVNLADKFDKDFYSQVIGEIKSSKLYSIRKFVAAKIGKSSFGFKELDKFVDIWEYAFKYERATIKTTKGNIVVQFNSDIAPISVANFCMLAQQNFYNGIIFHRVVPGFVIQAGDPTATGWGGPGYDIISEFSDSEFGIGCVGMASAGKDTESSQFFIMQGSHPHLDSRYTLFAKVSKGMDVVYNITEEDKIISIELK